jgi:uncharacterized protein (DUF1778 family)
MRSRTKKAMGHGLMVRLRDPDWKLLRAAAAHYEVSMSDIVRDAVRPKVKALLKNAEQEAARPRGPLDILADQRGIASIEPKKQTE